jgi:TolB-like protein/Tfp pilus assembly protein PilF
MNKFFEELKRRNVIKSTIAYLVVAWILLQVINQLLDTFNSPDWIKQTFTVALAIGLPVWIVISWIYQLTPQGVEKTTKESENELVTQATNKRLNAFIIASLSIAVIVLALNLFVFNSISDDSNKQYAIAVLPFESMDNGQDDFFFVDGMAMDIHTYLSKIQGLSVISDKTIQKYRGSDKTNPEIAKELGVDYLINGNVRKYDDEVKITAQLIDANDVQVWAEPYTRKFVDIFKLQQDVSKEIAEQLKVELTPEEEEALDRYPTENMEAYNLFLKGRSLVLKRGISNINKALELFQQALDLDSNYAEVYAEMGYCYYLLATSTQGAKTIYDLLDYDEALDKTNLYLEKALKINPNTFRVYVVKAMIAGRDGFRDEMKEYYEKALAINPNDAEVQLGYSFLFSNQIPDIENRIKHIKIAQQLEPFSVRINRALHSILLLAGKIQEAEDHLNRMGFIFPNSLQIRLESYTRVHKNKDWTEAIRLYEEKLKQDPNNHNLNEVLGNLYDEVLNDNVNFLKHYKKAYEIDSTSIQSNQQYIIALLDNKKFIEAFKFMESENFKSVFSKPEQLQMLFIYYMYQDYPKALEITKDTLFKNNYLHKYKVFVYAALGDRENFNRIINENTFDNIEMAELYAILKEKDSMYHYLDKLNGIYAMKGINASSDFDPYRKDERFKALLKKSYLPLTHWNE